MDERPVLAKGTKHVSKRQEGLPWLKPSWWLFMTRWLRSSGLGRQRPLVVPPQFPREVTTTGMFDEHSLENHGFLYSRRLNIKTSGARF